MQSPRTRASHSPETTPSGGDRQPIKVRDLLRDGPVLELEHDGQIYRLRITRNRKLILTK